MPYLENSKSEQKRLNDAVKNLTSREISITPELIIMQFKEGSHLTISHNGGLEIKTLKGSW